MKIKDLIQGETSACMDVLVTSINEKADKNGNPYLLIEVSDGENKIPVRIFSMSEETAPFEVGDVLSACLNSSLYNGTMTFKMTAYEVLDGVVSIADFVVSAPMTDEEMNKKIETIINSITNAELKKTVRYLFEKYEEQLTYYPAAKTHHHNYYGGLKYHSLCVALNALAMAKTYDFVNNDVIIAASLLHDIGKLFEYNASIFGEAEYCPDGNLFGHLFMGAETFKKTAEEFNVNPEIIRCVVHCILSHHDNLEWEAIKRPSTLEARIVASADYVDSQIDALRQAVENTEPGTCHQNMVAGVRPYRPMV